MTCFVYFVQAGDDRGAIKIGYSGDVEKRVESLRTGNHLPLRILAKFDLGSVDAAAAFEKEMHAAFIDLRLEGGWFAHDARILEVIDVLHAFETSNTSTRTVPPQLLRQRMVAAPAADLVVFGPTSAPQIEGWHSVLWSYNTGHLHIEPLTDSVHTAFLQHIAASPAEPNDYVIVGIAPSRDDADALASVVEPTLRAMRIVRRTGIVSVLGKARR